MDPDQQEATRLAAAEWDYRNNACKERNVNQYRIDDYTEYTETFRDKLHKINQIISAYRYDASNSQVDYYDTNFYYDIRVKPSK